MIGRLGCQRTDLTQPGQTDAVGQIAQQLESCGAFENQNTPMNRNKQATKSLDLAAYRSFAGRDRTYAKLMNGAFALAFS